uniref:Uncharacterized protein n=1 Tax=Arundo donax TaxID=35708 RepID=A0A0A9DL29_ARUDO
MQSLLRFGKIYLHTIRLRSDMVFSLISYGLAEYVKPLNTCKLQHTYFINFTGSFNPLTFTAPPVPVRVYFLEF